MKNSETIDVSKYILVIKEKSAVVILKLRSFFSSFA